MISELLMGASEIFGMVYRGTVQRVNDSTLLQSLQLRISQGATPAEDDLVENVENFAPYGLTAVPVDPTAAGAAEAIVVNVSADSEHPVIIAVADRRYRVTGLASGDVCVYNAAGQSIKLLSDRIVIESGSIEIGAGAVEKLVLGDSFMTLYNAHTHNDPVAGVTGVPVAPMTAAQLSVKGKVS
mgnify:CR=1 FL=1